MALIYSNDIVPILISWLTFFMLATAHRILLPAKYSAFLQFKEDEDVKKTIQSTSIRIIYLVVGTCVLNLSLKFSEKQIGIGIFIACFLNVWPAIIQNQLLKLRKNRTEWLVLMGYIVFIGTSLFVEIMTIRLFIPLFQGDTTVYWLDNQAITFLFSLMMMAFPVPVEALISKFARIVVVQTIDTFIEEVYILEHQLNMECSQIENNRYCIDKVSRENDINAVLLETILRLEIFYRGRLYNRILEKIICKFFGKIAIKKNISVGMAQIKISTAGEILKENPQKIIKKICEDEINIEVCAKLLKKLIIEYEELYIKNIDYYEMYEDVYDYITCEYMGEYAWQKNKTALVYSAVLRSFMKEEKMYYVGSEQSGRCMVKIFKDNTRQIHYDEFQKFIEEFDENIIMQKKIFVKGHELALEFISDDKSSIKIARNFAEEKGCTFEMIEL